MGVRILVGIVAVLRAMLIYGEVSAAEAWEPRRPAWLRRTRVEQPATQPASQLAHAA